MALALINVNLAAQTTTTDPVEFSELVFRNPRLISGIAGKEGAEYLFPSIAPGVDGKVRLKKFSNPKIVVKNIDNTTSGWDKAFQPEFGMDPVPANANWYIDFELTFLAANTTTSKLVDRFTLTSIDVDGDNVNVSEYVVMEKASAVTYASSTHLQNGTTVLPTCGKCGSQSKAVTCTACNGTGKDPADKRQKKKCSACSGVGKVYEICKHPFDGQTVVVKGPVNNFDAIDTAATSVMANYVYNNKDVVNFRIGATSGRYNNYGMGVRLNSLWFKSFSLAPPDMLPVKLAAFSVIAESKNAHIKWTAAMEENFSHYVIERSTDGTQFKPVAVMLAIGNTSSPFEYKYVDKDLPAANPRYYYRLQMVDGDKTFTYSNVCVISNKQGAQNLVLQAFPNPFKAQVEVLLPKKWQQNEVYFHVYNLAGNLVYATKTRNAQISHVLHLGSLQNGLYVLKASCNGLTTVCELVKE